MSIFNILNIEKNIYIYIVRILNFIAKQAYIIPIYTLGYTYRYTKGHIGGSGREIKYILRGYKRGKGGGRRGGGFFKVIISSSTQSLLHCLSLQGLLLRV